MHRIQNLPGKFQVENLNKFVFGEADGKDDPLLETCALVISPVKEFLDENKSILVGDRGAGKTAVFRLLSERKIKFVNRENLKQVYIPIDEDLGYKTLREHVIAQIKDPTSQSSAQHRIVWELYIFSRCLDGLKESFSGNQAFEQIRDSFYDISGWKSQRKVGLLDLLVNTKKSFGVKLEGGHLGHVVPNFYTSVEPKSAADDLLLQTSYIDLPRLKGELNSLLSKSKCVSYVLIDKLDEFVSDVEYQTQLETLQALLHCWRDYQSYPKIKIKLFLRRDLYERLDFSSIGKDKIDPRKVDLKWTAEDIRQLMASRIFHNLAPVLRGKALRFECNEEVLKIDRAFLREIRAIDSMPESEKSVGARLRRAILMIRAKIRQRKRDEYDARTTNLHDLVNRAVITVIFPRSVSHQNRSNKTEQIEIAHFIETHFQLSNEGTTPRSVLLFMQKGLEIARNYYSSNPEKEIAQNEKGEYPVFLRDHLCEAYNEIRRLSLQTIIGLHHQWSRPATLLMQAIQGSKTPDQIQFRDAKKVIGKALGDKTNDALASFFAFYEHAGLFRCINRTQNLEARVYSVPIFFQRVLINS
ncbi:MAG TPA: hypothetical protein VJ673_08220 [Aromatoleum sp.]|uniref:P-loop ATPase, Sll1717 family n=1 Tax=Aromatoleum sp. TaxID=2307007 RepID=UPI002B464AA6|nr:hypothetical protein [Aromatoleum sp.]HJV25658.1 hypothetical protein [Aromatoleum sp.]